MLFYRSHHFPYAVRVKFLAYTMLFLVKLGVGLPSGHLVQLVQVVNIYANTTNTRQNVYCGWRRYAWVRLVLR